MSNDNLWFQRTETPEPEPTKPTPGFWRRFEKKHPWIFLILAFPFLYAGAVYEDVQHGLPQGTSNPTLHRP